MVILFFLKNEKYANTPVSNKFETPQINIKEANELF
jgi:hypothetical protein